MRERPTHARCHGAKPDRTAQALPGGSLALFHGWDLRTRLVAMLRKTNGAAPQILGEGDGFDLSPDGRAGFFSRSGGVCTYYWSTVRALVAYCMVASAAGKPDASQRSIIVPAIRNIIPSATGAYRRAIRRITGSRKFSMGR